MAENDIYDNKRRYENFKNNIEQFCLKPSERSIRGNQKSKYYIKNKDNVQYFRKLFLHFDSRDLSFVRRMRASQALMLICFATDKNLVDCVRDDINGIVAYMHSVYSTPNSKADFIKDLKYLWRTLFPETDIKGRVDETLTPYVVRHLSGKIDKSKEKMRNDRLSWDDVYSSFSIIFPINDTYFTESQLNVWHNQNPCLTWNQEYKQKIVRMLNHYDEPQFNNGIFNLNNINEDTAI